MVLKMSLYSLMAMIIVKLNIIKQANQQELCIRIS